MIAMSGDDALLEKALKLGAYIIQKPVRHEQLIDVIQTIAKHGLVDNFD